MLSVILLTLSAIAALLYVLKMMYPRKWAFVTDEIKYNFMGVALYIAFITGDALYCFKNVQNNPQERKDHVAIVTGGGRGLGASIVEGLMKNGMTVIIGVRRPESCEELMLNLTKKFPQGKVFAMKLDLSSMKSVKEFATEFLSQYSKLHILVNNAGILHGGFKLTEDGFEEKLAINYLGHFLLTHMMTDCMRKAGFQDGLYSRVVNVSSFSHIAGDIYWEDIHLKSNYHYLRSYYQSKLAQLMFSRRLDKRFEFLKAPVKSYAVNPGVVASDMLESATTMLGSLSSVLKKLIKTPQRGAEPVLFTCLSPTLEGKGAGYISNCTEGYSTALSKSNMEKDRLFNHTTTMLGIQMFGSGIGCFNLGSCQYRLQNENSYSL